MDKYYVYRFVLGYMLIDREALEFRFYATNYKELIGQVHIENCSIERLEPKRINGLIHLINSGNYRYKNAYAIDKYIYHFLLTKNQKEKCDLNLVYPKSLLKLRDADFVTSGNTLYEVVRDMQRIVNKRALVK